MNIYVGNLHYGLDEDQLAEVFQEYGSVDSAKIITDRDTGRSKGFGFVTMPDDTEARAAIEDLDGREVSGRSMRVNEARERPERSSAGGGYRKSFRH